MIRVPARPNEILFVPKSYDRWRPYQREVVERAVNSEKLFVVINAPTGFGKSLVGVSIAGLLFSKDLLEEGRVEKESVRIVTKTKPLQRQYHEDFKIPYVFGRDNYKCAEYPSITAEHCPYSSYNDCPIIKSALERYGVKSVTELQLEAIACEYLKERERLRRDSIGVMNFHFFFYSHYYDSKGLWPHVKVLIIDEAHAFHEMLAKVFDESLNFTALIKDLETLRNMGWISAEDYNFLYEELFVKSKAEEVIKKKSYTEIEDTLLKEWKNDVVPFLDKLRGLLKSAIDDKKKKIGELFRPLVISLESKRTELGEAYDSMRILARLERYEIDSIADVNKLINDKLKTIVNSGAMKFTAVQDAVRTAKSIVKEIEVLANPLGRINKFFNVIMDALEYEEDFLVILSYRENKREPEKSYLRLGKNVVFPHMLFRKLIDKLNPEKVILMSATIFPEYVEQSLGIKREEMEFIQAPSIFPPERRPLLYVPKYHLNKKFFEDEENVKKYIKDLDKFLDVFDDMKGLIHTTSVSQVKDLLKYSRHADRMLEVYGKERDKVIKEKFENSNEPLILVSPSSWEGLDMKYDLARFQIIYKVPFADLGDPVSKKRLERSREWYRTDAMLKLIQGYGRIMREKDDWGITLIMDDNFGGLLAELSVPDWFKEAIVRFPSYKYSEALEFAREFKEQMNGKKEERVKKVKREALNIVG